MGPMLNIFLLTLQLDPKAFVGTRSSFFTVINTIKLVQRLCFGSLPFDIFKVSFKVHKACLLADRQTLLATASATMHARRQQHAYSSI